MCCCLFYVCNSGEKYNANKRSQEEEKRAERETGNVSAIRVKRLWSSNLDSCGSWCSTVQREGHIRQPSTIHYYMSAVGCVQGGWSHLICTWLQYFVFALLFIRTGTQEKEWHFCWLRVKDGSPLRWFHVSGTYRLLVYTVTQVKLFGWPLDKVERSSPAALKE